MEEGMVSRLSKRQWPTLWAGPVAAGISSLLGRATFSYRWDCAWGAL